MTAQVGDTVTFKCTASSKPPSTVIIVKIGKFAMRSKQHWTYHVWTCGSIGPVTSTFPTTTPVAGMKSHFRYLKIIYFR